MHPREKLLFQIHSATRCRLDEVVLLTWKQISVARHDGRDNPYVDLTGFHTFVKTEAARRIAISLVTAWAVEMALIMEMLMAYPSSMMNF